MQDKRLATAVATLLAAFATAHLMQFGLSAGALLSGKGEAAPIGLATLVARPDGGAVARPAPVAGTLPPGDSLASAPDRPRDGAQACARSLTARPAPGAVIRAELRAPCDPGARVEIAHAGLRFAMATASDGRLVAEVPAMRTDATVAARFADGSVLETRVAIPEAQGLERVAVMAAGWAGFTLHAFEAGAGRGTSGHVHAGAVGERAGAMVRLGDAQVDAPLLAQVYTLPAGRFGALGGVRFELEAVVTPANCARDVAADFVRSGTGAPPLRLGLSIPSCEAAGELLVLPLPATDLRLARN
jgi:hypothetical protein